VPSLLALDFELGPELERAIRDAVDSRSRFAWWIDGLRRADG